MPALIATETYGVVTWLGCAAGGPDSLESRPAEEIFAAFAGLAGDVHEGLTRRSCSRVTDQYPRGTIIRNTRQFSVLCAEELALIAEEMGLDALNPSFLGATMVISGIPDFTHLPPSSRLQSENGATLVVDMANRPCALPGKVIERAHPRHGSLFKSAARGRRGITAWVEREGLFHLRDTIRLHVPDQRVWAGR